MLKGCISAGLSCCGIQFSQVVERLYFGGFILLLFLQSLSSYSTDGNGVWQKHWEIRTVEAQGWPRKLRRKFLCLKHSEIKYRQASYKVYVMYWFYLWERLVSHKQILSTWPPKKYATMCDVDDWVWWMQGDRKSRWCDLFPVCNITICKSGLSGFCHSPFLLAHLVSKDVRPQAPPYNKVVP